MACALAPGIAAWGFYLHSEWRATVAEAQGRARSIAAGVAADIDGLFRDYEAVLSEIAARPAIRALDSQNCDPILKEYAGVHRELASLTVREATGRLICSASESAAPTLPADQAALTAEGARANGLYISDVILGASSGRWITAMLYPVRDSNGRTSAVLVAPLNLLQYSPRLLSGVKEDTIVSVLDRNLHIAMRGRDLERWIGKPLPAQIADTYRNGTAGYFRAPDLDGIDRIGAFVSVPRTGWKVALGLPASETLQRFRRRSLEIVAGSIALLSLVLFLIWRMANSIATPMSGMAQLARDIEGGKTDARAVVAGPPEVRNVAQQLNKMLDAIERHGEERRALARHIETVMHNAPDVILLVDRSGGIFEVNDAAVATYGFSAAELRKMAASDLRAADAPATPDHGVAALEEGVRFEDIHRRKDGTRFPVEISSRALDLRGVRYVQSFVRDITERRQREAEAQEYLVQLERMFQGTIDSVSKIVELRDPYTAGHERRVGELAAAIGAEMGLDRDRQYGLRIASGVHDIGKISVPAEILTKPTHLTKPEIDLVRDHAAQGFDILRRIDSPWPIAEVARQHHERMDGSGYPRGLRGEDILLEARIVAVADVVEAMASHRPYRPGQGLSAALDEIEKGSGQIYDAEAVAACLRLFHDKSFHFST